jgi:hypothetical protein
VNFCYVNSGFASAKTLIKGMIDGSWGVNSGLTLNWPANSTDVCRQDPAGSGHVASRYLPIYLHAGTSTGDWGGRCAGGYSGRMPASYCGGTVQCQCEFSTADLTPDPTAFLGEVAIHEIGHGLGLRHEHQRSDRPSNITTTCVDPNNSADRWLNNSNYVAISDLKLLTQYDGTLSIMSYCRDWNQDGIWDDPPFPVLSSLDALGIEMMYPKNYGRKPVLSGFSNADGSQFIVRSDVATSMNVDWVVRGGLPSSLHNVQWANASSVFASSASASKTITADSIIKVQLDDAFGRHHPWTQTTAVASNAKHTGILMSTAIML